MSHLHVVPSHSYQDVLEANRRLAEEAHQRFIEAQRKERIGWRVVAWVVICAAVWALVFV